MKKITISKEKGFTLIELLVVIAIIGILAALVTASISESRAKARDATRISQMQEVETALELYYLEFDRYPSANTSNYLLRNSGLDENFIKSIPEDPLFSNGNCSSSNGTSDYCYNAPSDGQSYTLKTTLETADDDRCRIQVSNGGWDGWSSSPLCSEI